MNAFIAEMHQEIAGIDGQIIKEEKTNQEIEEKLNEMDKKKDTYKQEIEALQ